MTLERRALEVNQDALRREDFYFDHATGMVHLTETQDVMPIAEVAKRNHDYTPDKHGRWKGDAVSVAQIPVIFIHKLMQEGILDTGFRLIDEKRFRGWLEEHSAFKTTPGRY